MPPTLLGTGNHNVGLGLKGWRQCLGFPNTNNTRASRTSHYLVTRRWPQEDLPRETQIRLAAALAPSAAVAATAPLAPALAPHTVLSPTPLLESAGSGAERSSWEPPAGRPGVFDSEGRLVLKSLTLPELEAWCAAQGEPSPANRALQLWRWMYADPPAAAGDAGAAGAWVRRLEDTLGRQNGVSAKFVDKVGPRVTMDGGLTLQRVVRSSDGTRKLVFGLTHGPAAGGSIEAVLIPVVRRAGLRDRLTICVSSQVGCAMNCQFCYTGRMGLLGNLITAQIVEQVVEARRFLAEEGDRTPLTNLVFMGMGEPLHNAEAVLAAAEIVGHHMGLHISHNKMTISTVGLVPEMRAVVARTRVQMALSLHATTDEVRDWIVPVNRRYDLATLTAALEELFPKVLLPRPEEPAADAAQSPVHEAGPALRAAPEARGTQAAGDAEAQAAQRAEAGPTGRDAEGPDACCSGREAGSLHDRSLPVESGVAGAAAVGGWTPSRSPSTLSASPSGSDSASAAPAAEGTHDGSGGGGESTGTSGRWLPPLQASVGAGATAIEEGKVGADEQAERSRGEASSSKVAGSSRSGSGDGGGEEDDGGRDGGGIRGDRSLLVEYTMLHGINDTLEDAERLASMLSRVNCKVNLIVFNPHAGTRFRPSTDEDICAFRSALIQRGLVCTIRDSRGDDEMAACGQLGNVGLSFRPSPLLEPPERFRKFLLPPLSAAGGQRG